MNYTVAVPAAATASPIRRAQGRPTHLSVEGVDLDLPDGQPLMANINFSLLRGESAGWYRWVTGADLTEALPLG